MLGTATFCVLLSAVEYRSIGPAVLLLLVPVVALLYLFFVRERRLTRERKDPLVDLRLFRQPSYTAGVVLALAYFPAHCRRPAGDGALLPGRSRLHRARSRDWGVTTPAGQRHRRADGGTLRHADRAAAGGRVPA